MLPIAARIAQSKSYFSPAAKYSFSAFAGMSANATRDGEYWLVVDITGWIAAPNPPINAARKKAARAPPTTRARPTGNGRTAAPWADTDYRGSRSNERRSGVSATRGMLGRS